MGWRIVCILGVLLSVQQLQCNAAAVPPVDTDAIQLTTKQFQVNFLNEITDYANKVAQKYLDEYLKQLELHGHYETHEQELAAAQQSDKLEQKVVFIKQLLDMQHAAANENEHFYALRNANFLKKFKEQLIERQEECAQQLRKLRVYHLCRQFEQETRPQLRYLAPLSTSAEKEETANGSRSLNLVEFGQNVYERVKLDGAHIIDDYLGILRKILYEVIEVKPEQERQHAELRKVLLEVDNILNTTDFYEKRQRLYNYLEGNLTVDFERFRSSAAAEEDLTLILNKLKDNGLNLFLNFLYSNFEFLEHLHDEWTKELRQTLGSTQFIVNEDAKLLHAINARYRDFKLHHEETGKYEDYIRAVKELFEKNAQSAEKVHIYELLHNASMNVGAGTLNMIKTECKNI